MVAVESDVAVAVVPVVVPAVVAAAVVAFCYQDRWRSTNENKQIDSRIEQ